MQDTLKRWQPTAVKRRNRQNQAREQHAARHAKRTSRVGDDCIDYFDCLMMLPYILVLPDKQEEVWRKALEKSAERERSRVEDKVVGWAREVANACP